MPVIFQIGGDALVVLDASSVERLSNRDPMVLEVGKIAAETGRSITNVIVTYGNHEDTAEIGQLLRAGRWREALRYACRGYEDRPEDSAPALHQPGKGPVC